MIDKQRLEEARQLIAFYDERGWDWTSALCFVLCRRLFGKGFSIYNGDVVSFTRRRYGKPSNMA